MKFCLYPDDGSQGHSQKSMECQVHSEEVGAYTCLPLLK